MTHEEKVKKKRQLRMEQLSYDADLKKNQRKQLDLVDQKRRFEQDRMRINMDIKENAEKMKKLKEKEDFMNEELRQIKKQLIQLA